MNEENMREEFEAWVKTKGWNTLRSAVYGFDYQSDITEEYWRAWQAACASKQKEIDELVEVMKEVVSSFGDGAAFWDKAYALIEKGEQK